jgi:hypothetical protein
MSRVLDALFITLLVVGVIVGCIVVVLLPYLMFGAVMGAIGWGGYAAFQGLTRLFGA